MREFKNQVFSRANYKCECCGLTYEKDMLSIHFDPLLKDEERSIDNVVVLCNKCNVKIGNRKISEFIAENKEI